jgi:hypothetical protein
MLCRSSFQPRASCWFVSRRQAEGRQPWRSAAQPGHRSQFLFGHTILRSVFAVGIVYAISIGLWNSLLLPFSLRALHANEFQYGLQEGLTSVGFVIGSLLMATWRIVCVKANGL